MADYLATAQKALARYQSQTSNVEPKAKSAPQWMRERNLDQRAVAERWQRYLDTEHGGQAPDLSQGTLLSQFNRWLEARGERPTTLPVLLAVLGKGSVASVPLRAEVARCKTCGGTDWGPSGRHMADGAAVWCCLECAEHAEESASIEEHGGL